ncbi:MAG TPA: NAD(P)/FAD-dependent oxidoreductase [Solirubrobacteraceae bacterium]|jgi:cation diffusion facilitator CzcD-associated flavoprotein CzcO
MAVSEISAQAAAHTEHVDVLIVGAGLSGIGAACHLQRSCPDRSFAILEARAAIGGTWDLFRYPGIRSDSDMFTLGYRFKPWKQAEAIADGGSIRAYIHEAAAEHAIEQAVRFNSRATRAEFSSQRARWTVEIERTDGPAGAPPQRSTITCNFLFGCTGYYRYDEGYTPQFPGSERFQGRLVHPQHWPEDLDYSGKRVLVIGSGATAVTLVPAMSDRAAHVTMLQRSPSYVLSLPGQDPLARLLRRVLPARAAYPVVRWKNVLMALGFYKLSRRAPRLMRSLLRKGVEAHLPAGYDVETHFNPRYEPWDQRVCFVPDGDMFDALGTGRASIVTDRIETFTQRGVLLASGRELEADVIVTATGLNLLALGGIEIAVDGEEVSLPETVGYKGMMLSGVPNLALTLGYTNASWTLKADLVAEYVCRLLNHMQARGYARCTPKAPPADEPTAPFLDLKSGYVERALDKLPRQGARAPWRLNQNYPLDVRLLRRGALEDEGIEFSRATAPQAVPAEPIAA